MVSEAGKFIVQIGCDDRIRLTKNSFYNKKYNSVALCLRERNDFNMKRKLSAALLAAAILTSSTASAYELPKSFWAPANRYAAALDSGNKNDIISAGNEIVSILRGEEKNEQVMTIIASKLYDMGYAYEELGGIQNHIKAGECFEEYIEYGKELGWTDGVKIAEQKSMQFKPSIDIYTPTSETQKYYGAVNEPEKGVLYGQVSETFEENESMILMYLEYGGNTDFTWPNHIFSEARKSGKAVELAVNFPYEGNQLSSIISDTSYINSLMSLLAQNNDIPIFLRIGAEVNVWTNKADPTQFIEAFRKIASAAKSLGGNIATVWSIMHTSEWSTNPNDYYPGDEYVDWVGISAYANKYFLARNWPASESHNPIVYKAGDAADPVLMIADIVKEYGDRKPIMLAECGSAYYTKGEINEYSSIWAETSLKRMYSMIPLVYPQVKLIAYFNKNMPNELNYYDLSGCSELSNAYNEITKAPWFIQDSASNKVSTAYERVADSITAAGALRLYAYPHVYGDDLPTVNYYIDGNWVTSVSSLPYERTIDLSAYTSGSHKLTAEVSSNGEYITSKDYTLNINADPSAELNSLNDIQKTALDYCKSKNVLSGYEDGTIKPYNHITRAEFASMTARLFGLSSDNSCTFDDAYSHWASKYIAACVNNGAIAGIGNNLFAPDSNVTFEQSVKILTVTAGLTDGKDLESMGGYPQAYINIGENSGILKNLSSAEIGGAITRIDVAMLFYNLTQIFPAI